MRASTLHLLLAYVTEALSITVLALYVRLPSPVLLAGFLGFLVVSATFHVQYLVARCCEDIKSRLEHIRRCNR